MAGAFNEATVCSTHTLFTLLDNVYCPILFCFELASRSEVDSQLQLLILPIGQERERTEKPNELLW